MLLAVRVGVGGVVVKVDMMFYSHPLDYLGLRITADGEALNNVHALATNGSMCYHTCSEPINFD